MYVGIIIMMIMKTLNAKTVYTHAKPVIENQNVPVVIKNITDI